MMVPELRELLPIDGFDLRGQAALRVGIELVPVP
jgi:hypothetical protein